MVLKAENMLQLPWSNHINEVAYTTQTENNRSNFFLIEKRFIDQNKRYQKESGQEVHKGTKLQNK